MSSSIFVSPAKASAALAERRWFRRFADRLAHATQRQAFILARFDADGDGQLNEEEEAQLRSGIRDYMVGIWDGISWGLASMGWGEGGAIDTLTDTFGGK